MNQKERRKWLTEYLIAENRELQGIEIPEDEASAKQLLRALMNVRPPYAIEDEFLKIQDEYLQEEAKRKGIVSLNELKPVQPGIYLWKGDITRLKTDAIVNAANSQMLGCFHPNHGCIDNAIHTYAGVQLRQECSRLMAQQKTEEKTGQARITRAWNLPCKYVIHTVGPIVWGKLTREDERLLADCYKNCLKLADEYKLSSIAFCCISTGEFHFPNQRAAEIAVETVREYREQTGSRLEVVFNVFKEMDETIYRRLLCKN